MVFVVEPPLTLAPLVLLYCWRTKAKSWLHVQDFEVDAAFDLGIIKGRVVKNAVLKAEMWLLRKFDTVSSISGKMIERLCLKGVASKDCVLFPNWTSFSDKKGARSGTAYRESLAIRPEKIVVMYSGNMGGKQGLEILGLLAQKMKAQRQFHFIFCGNGPAKKPLEGLCEGLANVTFLPLQPADKLEEFLSFADIHLLPQRADAADLVMPSKLTGIMASGRPVVVGAKVGTELHEIVMNVARCGIAVVPENAEEMAAAIIRLGDDSGLREQLGANGRAFAYKVLSKESVLSQFQEQAGNLCSRVHAQ